MFDIKKIYKKRAMAICPYHKSKKGTADLDITLEGEYAGYYRCWGCGKSGKIADFELASLLKKRNEIQFKEETVIDFQKQTKEYEHRRWTSKIESPLDVSIKTMIRLEWGWDGTAHTFPERNAEDQIIGILRRFPDRNKGVVSGSKRGLTIPRINFDITKPLYITEGMSDLSVVLECGLQGIARPNCNSCIEEVIEVTERRGGIHLIGWKIFIVADNDEPGLDGADWLANRLGCNVIVPEPYKDLYDMYLEEGLERTKEWLQA